jgi:hypothetical protein
MRLVMKPMLAVGMAWTLASPVTAAVDVTVLDEDTRIELPEAGMAVTMPAGWEVWADHGGAIFETALTASPSGAAGGCVIQVFRFDGATVLDVAEFLGTVYWDFEEFVISEISLPDAEYVVRLQGPGTSSPLPGTTVAYVFDAGDGYAWLWCDSTSAAPPDDLWLSIADTIELLPADE